MSPRCFPFALVPLVAACGAQTQLDTGSNRAADESSSEATYTYNPDTDEDREEAVYPCDEPLPAGIDYCVDFDPNLPLPTPGDAGSPTPIVERFLIVPLATSTRTETWNAEVESEWFTAEDSVMNTYVDHSGGMLSFEFDVADTVFIDTTPEMEDIWYGGCDTYTWSRLAREAGDLPSGYNRTVFLMPAACLDRAGQASLGQPGATTDLWMWTLGADVFDHEFGHSLGFGHASEGDAEYGDGTSVMGWGNRQLLAAPQLIHHNWLDESVIITNKGGERALTSLDDPEPGAVQVHQLDIPTGRYSEDTYLISYRTRTGPHGPYLHWMYEDEVSVHKLEYRRGRWEDSIWSDQIASLSAGESIDIGEDYRVVFDRIEDGHAMVTVRGPGIGCSSTGSPSPLGLLGLVFSVLLTGTRKKASA